MLNAYLAMFLLFYAVPLDFLLVCMCALLHFPAKIIVCFIDICNVLLLTDRILEH